MGEQTTQLSDHLFVYRGPINVGILRDGEKAMLFDFGDGSVADTLPRLGITAIDAVAFTHHHRDQACGLPAAAGRVRSIGVPAAERALFENPGAFWSDPKNRWYAYAQLPHHLTLVEPVRVDVAYVDRQEFAWGPARITVLATPGHTQGSVSYAADVDGKRTIFCGDAICDEGKVWDIHSLQKGTLTSDYHGFLGARPQLEASLGRIKDAKPAALVPSHGKIMNEPAKAIDALVARLDLCYDKYVAISALRHYFPEVFTAYAQRRDHMPIRKGRAVPACLRHFNTSWILVSKDKAAFVMDCGDKSVIDEVKKLLAAGTIRSVEGLWITHHHFDHMEFAPEFLEEFKCPCIADAVQATVLTDPMAWRLSCLSPKKLRVDRPCRDGESWPWHEFQMTAYHFPGQTLYHSGLVAEAEGLKMLFAGDSFTMSGIDDYCSWNRNWLGRGVGFDHCLDLVGRLRPTHIFNCHVDVAFDFTDEEIRFMRANLAEREKLYGELVPWDHANYGMDEPWVRCHPFEQHVKPGSEAVFRVVVTNHSTAPRTASCRVIFPHAWTKELGGRGSGRAADWATAQIAAKIEGGVPLSLRVPADARPGRYMLAVDLRYGEWVLPQFTEAMIVVE